MGGSGYSVHADFPAFYLNNADTVKFLNVVQHWHDLKYDEIGKILKTIDVDTAEEKYLDLMLYETGWDLKIPLDANMKRKVIKLADFIYLNKGIAARIIDVVFLLTGIVIRIESVSSGNALQLDVTPLDDGYYLWSDGLGGSDAGPFEFQVLIPSLPPESIRVIDTIIDFMKWGPTIYTFQESN